MTSREGFDAYQLYLGIKLHFHSKDYDFVKYNGVVKAELPSFMKRKDKFHFGKLSRTYKHELKDFLLLTYHMGIIGLVTYWTKKQTVDIKSGRRTNRNYPTSLKQKYLRYLKHLR